MEPKVVSEEALVRGGKVLDRAGVRLYEGGRWALIAEIAVELEAVEERVRFLRRAGRAWKEEATRLRSRAVGMGEWGGKGWRDRYEYEEPAAHWEPDAERVAEALRDPEPARIVNPEDAVGTIGVIGTWEGVVLLGPGWKERGDGA